MSKTCKTKKNEKSYRMCETSVMVSVYNNNNLEQYAEINWYRSIPFQLISKYSISMINWNNHRSRIWQWIFYVRRLRTMVHVLISKALNFCSLKPYLFYLWIIIFCEGIPPYRKNCLLYEIMTDWWSFVGCPSGQNLTSPIMSARFCK